MLPGSVPEALQALKDDAEMVALIGDELVEKYAAVKEFELNFLATLKDDYRKEWLMQRY